ncbi:hypothetical protein B566_EDAN010690 [Ephemera danica]|nr:hypothetical protein B566_EDAN010690 [Ephemera danica]
MLLAVQGIRKYGKDFRAIAEVIGTKTEAHLRSYFVNYRRRFNLDTVLKEYEAEHGPVQEEEEKMEVDGVSSGSEAGTPTPGGTSPVPRQAPALLGKNTITGTAVPAGK